MLPSGALALLAVEVLALAVIACCYLVIRATWGRPAIDSPPGDWVWTLLLGLALVGGAVLVSFAVRAASIRHASAVSLTGLACIYGIIALGLGVANFGGWPAPFFEGQAVASLDALAVAPRQAGPVAAGNPDKGQPFYLATCAACHGPDGRGIAGTAPAYADTDFVAKTDELALARMIQKGRPITDPENRSKRAMPASGGNPFLSPQNLRDIAAYVKQLGTNSGAASSASDAGVQLPAWVIPAAAIGSAGTARETLQRWSQAQYEFTNSAPANRWAFRRASFLEGLFQSFNLVLIVHVAAAVMGALASFATAGRTDWTSIQMRSLTAVSRWWALGAAMWLGLVGIFFVLG
jgi:disulfide bond formation protein DsbB